MSYKLTIIDIAHDEAVKDEFRGSYRLQLLMKWNKPLMKMLNKTGPNIDPCGTHLCKSAQKLRQLPILTHSLRPFR